MERLKSIETLEQKITTLKADRQSAIETKQAKLTELENAVPTIQAKIEQAMTDGDIDAYNSAMAELKDNQTEQAMTKKAILTLETSSLCTVDEFIEQNEAVSTEYYSYIEPLKTKIKEAYASLESLYAEEETIHADMNTVLVKWFKDCMRTHELPYKAEDGSIAERGDSDNSNTDYTVHKSVMDFIRNDSTKSIVNE